MLPSGVGQFAFRRLSQRQGRQGILRTAGIDPTRTDTIASAATETGHLVCWPRRGEAIAPGPPSRWQCSGRGSTTFTGMTGQAFPATSSFWEGTELAGEAVNPVRQAFNGHKLGVWKQIAQPIAYLFGVGTGDDHLATSIG